ncbi:TetR/AcrR family transcriptional regulator [Streptomyces iconiensis]|uniref:TetR/AcrR family transcriptional regulator n=1 Tax=Streptomyces iconiensis TaxID=1384038 RepID=A0ABT6ZRX4_9ACTN|nr:TetR/AcrR family transcriptional regulator [Streptomyces iconiensis]MDJ1131789.1 TetR/AcrR family transcriptional regulator [Streptomyces iconiensis]
MRDGSRMSRMHRTSVWLDERPGVRRRAVGQAEGLDREKITSAAVRLLDTEGLAKFSMRRLAAELGVTAMSVYWYVDRKDDLLELALDAVEGELDVPDPEAEGADWRAQLRQVAHELCGLLRRHPWTSGMLGSFLNVGPSAVRYQLATRRVLLRAGLPARQADGALSSLFSFVYGHAAVEAGWNSRCGEAGISSEDCTRALRSRFGELSGDGANDRYGVRGDHGERVGSGEQGACEEPVEPVLLVGQRDFEVALDCVIAGIESLCETASSATTKRGPAVSGRPTPVIPSQPVERP